MFSLKGKARKVLGKKKFRFVSEEFITNIFGDAVIRFGKDSCLDIGSGVDGVLDDRFISLDEKADLPLKEGDGVASRYPDKVGKVFHPNYVGDIKALFAPGYCDNAEFVNDNQGLLSLPEGAWKAIRAKHIIEHIPWRYAEKCIEWMCNLLEDGGVVYIATPNLEFISKVYSVNLERQKAGEPVSYPLHEHAYFRQGVQWDMQRWANFKIFSGGSPGDEHRACFDTELLVNLLWEAGFRKISVFSGHTLMALAYKVPQNRIEYDDGLGESVRRAVEK